MSMVKDISQILRRERPSEKDIVEASKSLENHHDNLWLMDGEEDPEASHDRWNFPNETQAAGRKRRRLDAEDHHGNPSRFNDRHNLVHTATEAFFEITTMQNRAAFSYQAGGDFTSAAAQLHCTAEAGYDTRQKSMSREKSRLPSGRLGASHGNDDAAKANSGPILKDQGSLLSLWATKSAPNHLSDSIANSCLESKGSYNANLKTKEGQISQRGKIQKRHATLTLTQDETEVSHLRKPLNAIPPGLANHKLHSCPRQIHHRPIENDHAPTYYAFLSSSPPPIDGLAPQEMKLGNKVDGPLSTVVDISGGDTRPARTFHSTSMAQINEGASHSKKTLGIRRSMTGWTCRGNQRFSIPSKPRNGI